MKIKKIILIPMGSYEYHGEKLPPETDAIISQKIAVDLCAMLKSSFKGEVILLPSINYGLSLEHTGFPNTILVKHKEFYDYILNLFNSINEKEFIICVVNGHGGNINTLQSIEADYNYIHDNSKVIVPPIYSRDIQEYCVKIFGEFDTHAGSVEASLIAYYMNKHKEEYSVKIKKKFSGSLKYFRNIEIYPDGIIKELPMVISDPKKGKLLHEKIVTNLLKETTNIINNIESVKK